MPAPVSRISTTRGAILSERHGDLPIGRRELHGVGQHVAENLLQSIIVGAHARGRRWRSPHGNVLSLAASASPSIAASSRPGMNLQIEHHLAPHAAIELEQIVDQPDLKRALRR